LKAYGITGNLIDWFSSYSNGRRQKVVIKNNSSAYCEISAGVPQASVLNPLLFIIYINDIADKLVSLSRLFADDTSFGYLKNQDTMQLKNVIDHDLNEMDIW
jgi:retron-type reverse transcriptase